MSTSIKLKFNRYVKSQYQNYPNLYQRLLIKCCMKQGAIWMGKQCLKEVSKGTVSDNLKAFRNVLLWDLKQLVKDLK